MTGLSFVTGKSVNNKDALEDKKDDNELWEAQAAFLGPNLWDKTLPYDPDLKVQEVSNRNFITYCVLRVVFVCSLDSALGNIVAYPRILSLPLMLS